MTPPPFPRCIARADRAGASSFAIERLSSAGQPAADKSFPGLTRGFRDNFGRKSTPPFVSRIKFALPFSPIFNDAVSLVPGLRARFRRSCLPALPAIVLTALSIRTEESGGRGQGSRGEGRGGRGGRRRRGCERIDIGSFQAAGRHGALFASSQSNE